MNKTTKTLSFAVAMFAIVGMMGVFNSQAYAAPKGIDPDEVGKQLFNFNINAVKKVDWDANGNACNGHRIFYDEATNGQTIGTLTWIVDPSANGIQITDCDGVGDKEAEITIDEKIEFFVFVKVNGKAKSSLDLICEQIVPETPTDDLCLVDTVKLSKNGGFTKIMQNTFNDEYAEVLWTLDCTNNSGDEVCAKHIQVRIYEKAA